MKYEVYGPFPVPTILNGSRQRSDVTDFWSDVDEHAEGLSKAVGIYVFSTKHGSNYTPWYVGKTCAKSGFRGEVFQSHKLGHYVSASETKKGVPHLHLIPKVTANTERFCRASQKASDEIDILETALIGLAWQANADVRNDRKTAFLKACKLPGIYGKPALGARPEGVRTLRNAFSLD